jgi:hypothetical protein
VDRNMQRRTGQQGASRVIAPQDQDHR